MLIRSSRASSYGGGQENVPSHEGEFTTTESQSEVKPKPRQQQEEFEIELNVDSDTCIAIRVKNGEDYRDKLQQICDENDIDLDSDSLEALVRVISDYVVNGGV